MTKKTHLSIKESGVVAAMTTIVGYIVAYVPAWAPYKAKIIADGGIVIAAAFIVANAVHAIASSHNISLAELKTGLLAFIRDELGKINFNALVQDAVRAHGIGEVEKLIETQVRAEIQKLFGAVMKEPAPSAPVQVIPSAPVAAPPIQSVVAPADSTVVPIQ